MPLTEAPFGLVIVTVIVVVDVPPTGTVEGLNDFDIVRGNPWARSGGANATRVKSTKRRTASIDSAPSDCVWRSIAGGLRKTSLTVYEKLRRLRSEERRVGKEW